MHNLGLTKAQTYCISFCPSRAKLEIYFYKTSFRSFRLTDETATAEVYVVNDEGDHEGVGVGHNLIPANNPLIAIGAIRYLAAGMHQVWVQNDAVLQLGQIDVLLVAMGLDSEVHEDQFM